MTTISSSRSLASLYAVNQQTMLIAIAFLAVLSVRSDAEIACPPGWLDVDGTCVFIKCNQGDYYNLENHRCEWIVPCYSIEFQIAEPTHTSSRLCQVYTKCCKSQYEWAAPIATTDRVCSACQDGASYQVQASSNTSDAVCFPFTACSELQFEWAAPTPSTDRVCVSCDFSHYQTSARTPTSDAVCLPLTDCAGLGQYLSGRGCYTDHECDMQHLPLLLNHRRYDQRRYGCPGSEPGHLCGH